MPDFNELLSKPADGFKRPPVLPAGTYYGTVTDREFGESSQKKTPYVRYMVRLTHAGEDVPPELLQDDDGNPIDVSKKSLRSDFYLTDDASYRLVEFIQSFGVETSGRGLGEIIEDAVGQAVACQVAVSLNQQTQEPFNELRSISAE